MPIVQRSLLALALLFLTCGHALAHPALWQVKSGNSTVYLFGTVHLLPNDTDWHFPALNQALAHSSALYIELTDDDQASMTSLVLRYGVDTAHPLSTELTQQDNVALAKAAQLAGLPGGTATLQPMKPWLAAITLSIAPLMKAGLDPAEGVDKQLKAQMIQAGKPVYGLETAQQQILFLADLPMPMQIAFLRDTLRDVEKDKQELLTLIDAWKQGDVAAITKLENDELKTQEPALYQTLLVQRNANWAAKIKDMLKQPGTVFVAVGAAHLAGPDSVQAQLAKLGVTAQQD
ncbi:TraB/GumN family protein [Dyella monticola]|uniref:TraB/GumN family protein n=1 Tax=Dyella monticola TaxID=1927958 RepID=A0A370WYY7_9GAMM|nr:TraB/GumN family protein [Dyella monticola]RDS81217.1 TraB/GumN family protein [Dyella monticola]